MADGPPLLVVLSTPAWHIDAVRGPSTQHCEERFAPRSNLDRTSEVGPRLLRSARNDHIALRFNLIESCSRARSSQAETLPNLS
jgi:hypothetical protein